MTTQTSVHVPPSDSLRLIAERWLRHDPDVETAAETRELLAGKDLVALERAFGARLQFGTAGLRGTLGPGPNHMNRALVRFATAGLADYLHDTVPGAEQRGVVVGHDARRGSVEFAAEAVSVLRGAGFRVFTTPPYSPTPLVAFAVLEHDAAAGIVVTASHNPPEYNGYKVYWGNGAQIIPPHDHGIAAAIDAVIASERLIPNGVGAEPLGEAIEHAYAAAVTRQAALIPLGDSAPGVRVVYTPLHGVGARHAEPAMRAEGAEVITVADQREPDGRFPTVRFPNPEEVGALDHAEALVMATGATVLVANDPDADRLAAAVRVPGHGGQPATLRRLSGDELGAVLADALLEARGRERNLADDAFVARSLVSSELLVPIAAHHGARAVETLTGFKWLWNASLGEIARGGTYVFAYEEALGYSVGPIVRDKDGIAAAATLVRIARSGDLLARLYAIYERYGYYGTRQKSVSDASPGGLARLTGQVQALCAAPPTEIAGLAVVRSRDFQKGEHGLPPTEGVGLWLSDGTRLLVRPSGTEPKIKIYSQVVVPWSDRAEARAGEQITALESAIVALLV